MAKEQSKRIQTSMLNGAEKRLLMWLAQHQPRWVTSDMMTCIGIFGSIVIAAGYVLSGINVHFLWLSSLGFVINWYGDSLDGTIARVRNQQRPVYGYYLDHTIDAVNECFMFIGAGLSPFIDIRAALVALVLYLMLTLNVSMNAHLRSEFKLTYAGFGPTEFRLVMILLNTALIFFGEYLMSLNIVMYIVWGIIAILGIVYVVTVIKDIMWYSKEDPMPEPDESQTSSKN